MRQRLAAIWVIARRELVTRARSEAFRISTALLLAGMVAGITIPSLLARGPGHYTVAVAGPATGLPSAIIAHAAGAGITVTTRPAADRAAALSLVESGAASAAVVGTRELIWDKTADNRLAPILTRALNEIAIAQRASAMGLTPAQARDLLAAAGTTVTRLHPQPDRGPQVFIATMGMILLFIALNFYGSYVLTGVVEEKSSRVVEVVLARVRPSDLLAGKVAGIGLLGIGQFAALALAGAVTLEVVRPPRLPAGTVPLIGGVVLWFVLGYSFYSVLYGALGALASRTEDAQAVVAPLTVIMLLAYFGAFAAIGSPRAWWVTAASLFPPTAPMFMPLRAAMTDVPAWQTALAVAFMILGILALVRQAGASTVARSCAPAAGSASARPGTAGDGAGQVKPPEWHRARRGYDEGSASCG